jgi:hypothetical protein
MMADQKFFELQKLLEVQLTIKSEARYELLSLYFETLTAQQKILPFDLAIELAELSSLHKKHEFSLNLLQELKLERHQRFFSRILKIKIQAAEDKGQRNELYNLISDFLLRQFEKQVPVIPDWIRELINKYFLHDFNLQLKELSLCLMLSDLDQCEKLTKELITSCVEKSTPRGISEKLLSIGEVLRSGVKKGQLEIYQNFCLISAKGITDKTDYKRIVEMIILFSDFKFQTLLLNLLAELELDDEATEFAATMRSAADYDFVYLDKFFPHLKSYFIKSSVKKEKLPEVLPEIDLKLTSKVVEQVISPTFDIDTDEDEQKYFSLLKYQTYTSDQLCDLAVSFLQSEMPKVALKASELAIAQSETDQGYLKGSYLKLTSLLLLKDYRAALDTCLDAISKATSKDDILSFLYGQAEIHIRLDQKKQAKNILSKILAIDSEYRLAKERLDRLNEI